MIVCPNCSSTAFEDMNFCYVCMQAIESPKQSAQRNIAEQSLTDAWSQATDEETVVEEPKDEQAKEWEPCKTASTYEFARFRIAMTDLFAYDMYLQKLEGKELTVGCAKDNNIVLPHTVSRRHPLRIYYANNQLWAEEKKCRQKVRLNGTVLTGAMALQSGAKIKVGKATIELIEP